jgi:hypothetical protein
MNRLITQHIEIFHWCELFLRFYYSEKIVLIAADALRKWATLITINLNANNTNNSSLTLSSLLFARAGQVKMALKFYLNIF